MRGSVQISLVLCLFVYSAGLALATLHTASLAVSLPLRFADHSVETPSASLNLFEYRHRVQTSGKCDVTEATHRVYHSTRHVSQREIRFSENWLQYLLGFCYPPLRQTQDADRLIRGGLGNCSDRCQILKSIVETAGFACRFVGLNGHVVLEVLTDEGWITCDPDYNAVYPVSTDLLSQPEGERVLRERLPSHWSPEIVTRYVAIFQSREDNVRLPIGSPLSPRLHRVETALNWMCWVIPAACMLFGSRRLLARSEGTGVGTDHPSAGRPV